jgi:hypothetical protein
MRTIDWLLDFSRQVFISAAWRRYSRPSGGLTAYAGRADSAGKTDGRSVGAELWPLVGYYCLPSKDMWSAAVNGSDTLSRSLVMNPLAALPPFVSRPSSFNSSATAARAADAQNTLANRLAERLG